MTYQQKTCRYRVLLSATKHQHWNILTFQTSGSIVMILLCRTGMLSLIMTNRRWRSKPCTLTRSQAKNKTQTLPKVLLPSLLNYPPFFFSSLISAVTFPLRGTLMVPVVLSKETCSVLVQIKQKQTREKKPLNPAGLTRHIWANLWVMIWSVYRCNASSSENQSLVTQRGELLQRITGSTLLVN